MRGYIGKRLLQGAITLFIASFFMFVIVRVAGDPVYMLLPVDATESQAQQLRRDLGLDQPSYVQYAIFLKNIAQGDFGNSFRHKRPVLELVAPALGNTAQLGVLTLVIAVLIAFPLGILAATKRGTWIDQAIRMLAVFGQSVPSFWLAVLFVAFIAGGLKILPAAGLGGPDHYILPVATLVLTGLLLSGVVRLLRSSMLEVLGSDYITLARAKGLSESLVLWKHALRNALVPVVTFLGFYVVMLVGGATFVVEIVFAWPGAGYLAYQSIGWRDYPVIQAIVIIMVAAFVVINLVIDIVYAYLDPRIRYGRVGL